MQGTGISNPALDGMARDRATATRRVIDAPTRMFHWLFALSFVGAYASGDSERWRALHVTLGYTMAGLLGFRLLYGLFGPRQARLGLLWRRLCGAAQWLRACATPELLSGSHWRQGQNLLMATTVASLLLVVLPLALSGYATYEEWGDVFGGDAFEALHEFFANALLVLVLAHLGLIAALSLLRGKNQARPMLSGRTDGYGPDLAKHNHAWLAGLLMVAVTAFGAWQWKQAPQGLMPAGPWSAANGDRQHHERD